MKKILIPAIVTLLISSACASDIETPAVPAVKVKLQDVADSGVVTPVNGFTTAGQPDKAAFRVFADNGYAAVIDLRPSGESRGFDEKTVVEELGMDYVGVARQRERCGQCSCTGDRQERGADQA